MRIRTDEKWGDDGNWFYISIQSGSLLDQTLTLDDIGLFALSGERAYVFKGKYV